MWFLSCPWPLLTSSVSIAASPSSLYTLLQPQWNFVPVKHCAPPSYLRDFACSLSPVHISLTFDCPPSIPSSGICWKHNLLCNFTAHCASFVFTIIIANSYTTQGSRPWAKNTHSHTTHRHVPVGLCMYPCTYHLTAGTVVRCNNSRSRESKDMQNTINAGKIFKA